MNFSRKESYQVIRCLPSEQQKGGFKLFIFIMRLSNWLTEIVFFDSKLKDESGREM